MDLNIRNCSELTKTKEFDLQHRIMYTLPTQGYGYDASEMLTE